MGVFIIGIIVGMVLIYVFRVVNRRSSKNYSKGYRNIMSGWEYLRDKSIGIRNKNKYR